MKKRTLFTSFLTVVMCLCLTVGATFALFTSQSEVDISVTSGNVNVLATASELTTDIYSGKATKNGNEITVERLVPGDSFSFDIEIENYSDVAVQYRTILSSTDSGLFTALKVTITDGANKRVYNGGYVYEDWALLSENDANATTAEDVKTLNVLVEFPDTGVSQNEYQGKSCTMNVLVEAVQGNASVVNPITKINDRHYQVNDAKGMMLVKGIASGMYTGEGLPCKFELTDNIDMTGYAWSPIEQMWIDFEGNGYTISNLNCGYDSWGRSGFFGYLGGGSVKNLNFENVTAEGTQVGIVAGAFEGRVENVTIKGNNFVKYNRKINPAETWGGVGAVAGVAQYVPTGVVIDGNVTVDYNGLITGAPVQNDFAQITNIESGVTVNGNVTAIGKAIYGFLVESDADLKTAIDTINKISYNNKGVMLPNAFWNTPVTVVMKAGVYTGNYHLNQWTTWNGITGGTQKVETNDQTHVTFLGEDGVKFEGYIKVTGNGNGQGDYVGYNAETKFIKIAFDGANLPLNSNGDKYNVEVCSGANNVDFENCSFANTTHVQLGGSKHNGTGDITFTGCKFKNSGVISGGPLTLTITNCEFDGSENGFVSVQRGGNGAGIVNVTNTIVKNVEEYGFRTNAQANITVEDSTIEVSYSETAGMGSLVYFRGDKAHATFTNCNLDYDTLVSYKNPGVDATTTSVTIDGQTAASLVVDGDTYKVYDINGLLEVNSLIANYNVSGKGNLQFIEGKTISIERDINARGKAWNCLTMMDLHGATDGFIFDGNGHTISNLVINGAAMFRKHSSNGVADPTVFKNITFDNVVNDGNEYFSAVIWAEMYGEIELNNVKIVNSNISGACNVAAFIGRNGAEHKGSEIKFVNCEVKDTIITSNAVESDDNAGASYFLGNALRGGNTTIKLTFEGENKYSNVTLNNNAFVVGGGVYTTADFTDATSWANPEVVYGFDNYVVATVATSVQQVLDLFAAGEPVALDGKNLTESLKLTDAHKIPAGSTLVNFNFTISSTLNFVDKNPELNLVSEESVPSVLENCNFLGGDFTAHTIIRAGKGGIVFNNCDFVGAASFSQYNKNHTNIVLEFNNSTFSGSDSMVTGFTVMGAMVISQVGTANFNNCEFDFTGVTKGTNAAGNKLAHINAYSDMNTMDDMVVVNLKGCTFTNCGTNVVGSKAQINII